MAWIALGALMAFGIHILILWIRHMRLNNHYNQNISIHGGQVVGRERAERDMDIIYLTGDDTDTLYRGEHPHVPITSSFSEMEICLYDPRQKAYYQCLLRDQIVVGRSAPESTAQIQIADGKVSRKHCQIYRQGERILIQDLGSTNHTYLNHCRVTGATPLMYGDLLTIGSVTYQFQYTF